MLIAASRSNFTGNRNKKQAQNMESWKKLKVKLRIKVKTKAETNGI
jgi:hypothetical protein